MNSKPPSLLPVSPTGHQFVIYADCCSGVAGGAHEATFAQVNSVVRCLEPQPQFICFPGDEIIGLTASEAVLREQWRYWFDVEIAWLNREQIPLYHTTGNHTTYNGMSERVYREVMSHLPQNGPADQKGLSYFVRRGDLLMVFIHTLWSGAGGEGHVEMAWLAETLADHADVQHKLVFGHHPIYPVNGFSGEFQREVGEVHGRQLWQLFVKHNILAYVCSHILAFDVQVHEGVLQILTAGAGTKHRMPEGIEYLHAVQAALDEEGLRYQVLDTEGKVREWLKWPFDLPPSSQWESFDDQLTLPEADEKETAVILTLQIHATLTTDNLGNPQTLLCGWEHEDALPSLWIGLHGVEQRLCVLMAPAVGRSPHLWLGPEVGEERPFQIQLAIHTGMGPGGILWRWHDDTPWHSLQAASPWGAERLTWPPHWQTGADKDGQEPFRGQDLEITHQVKRIYLR